MASPRARKPSGNHQTRSTDLTVRVHYDAATGTTVKWLWYPEGATPALSDKPMYEITREGFETLTLDECVEAIKGTWVAITMMRDAATKDN